MARLMHIGADMLFQQNRWREDHWRESASAEGFIEPGSQNCAIFQPVCHLFASSLTLLRELRLHSGEDPIGKILDHANEFALGSGRIIKQRQQHATSLSPYLQIAVDVGSGSVRVSG